MKVKERTDDMPQALPIAGTDQADKSTGIQDPVDDRVSTELQPLANNHVAPAAEPMLPVPGRDMVQHNAPSYPIDQTQHNSHRGKADPVGVHQTELSFLIDLLLNHKLTKPTKDLIQGRIKVVESQLNKVSHLQPNVYHQEPTQSQQQQRPQRDPNAQSPSMAAKVRALEMNVPAQPPVDSPIRTAPLPVSMPTAGDTLNRAAAMGPGFKDRISRLKR